MNVVSVSTTVLGFLIIIGTAGASDLDHTMSGWQITAQIFEDNASNWIGKARDMCKRFHAN